MHGYAQEHNTMPCNFNTIQWNTRHCNALIWVTIQDTLQFNVGLCSQIQYIFHSVPKILGMVLGMQLSLKHTASLKFNCNKIRSYCNTLQNMTFLQTCEQNAPWLVSMIILTYICNSIFIIYLSTVFLFLCTH